MTIGTISIIMGVILLIFLKVFFKDGKDLNQNDGVYREESEDLLEENPMTDPGLSLLSGNVFNHSDD